MNLHFIDYIVLLIYFVGLSVLGFWFTRRTNSSERFMAAGRHMPGWVLALTLFGAYVSSISFLANPGKSYRDNWGSFVFCLSLPLCVWIGVRWFVPFFRRSGEVSAYQHFEQRFGPWARTYATACFLCLQLARTGVVMYLLALGLQSLTGLDIRWIIIAMGILMTVYPLLGGTESAIWTGMLQSLVLFGGAIVSLAVLMIKMPGGPEQIFQIAIEHGKLGLGSFSPDLWSRDGAGRALTATFWMVLLYGVAENLKNFGSSQNFVQLYITARSDRDARQCVWMGGLLYIPVAAVFFLIGTALFAYYQVFAAQLPSGAPADQVFPIFIRDQMPAGVKGLVIAAVCAAATDSGFNCFSTLFLKDIYQRYFRPMASDCEYLWVLRFTTLAAGVISTLAALVMVGLERAVLDAWWEIAGIFAGGILGLFLLGLISRRANGFGAAIGVIAGTLLLIWMTFSLPSMEGNIRAICGPYPQWFEAVRSPFHGFLIPVFVTAAILGVGWLASLLKPARPEPADANAPPAAEQERIAKTSRLSC